MTRPGRRRVKARVIVVLSAVPVALIIGVIVTQTGGASNETAVREVMARFEKASRDKDYSKLCDELFAASYVRQTASSGLPCEVALLSSTLSTVRNPRLKVLSVEVNGDRAAVRVRGTAAGQDPAESVYTLVREDDAWRILPPRPGAATP